MKRLVTGHRGFIGSRLFKKLDAIGIDRVAGYDINDIPASELPSVEIVYHLAAQTDVQKSIQYPLIDAADNIMATIRLLMLYPNAKFIYISTAGAIDDGILSPYGLSKHTAEEYVKMLHDDYVICRLPNVYGGGNGVVDIFANSDKCVIYGDGSKTRNLVHIDDIVEGLIQAENWNKGSYTFAGESYSIKEIAEKTGKPIEYRDDRSGEVEHSTLKNTTPNWKPKIKL